jgi:hypothetical protein
MALARAKAQVRATVLVRRVPARAAVLATAAARVS